MLRIFGILLFSYSICIACVNAAALSLNELQNLSVDSRPTTGESSKSEIIDKAMKEAALTVGAQNGYVYRLGELQSIIKSVSSELDAVFDFNSLMRLVNTGEADYYLQPAIIEEVRDATKLSNDQQTLRISATIYNILEPEKLVITPTNWRSYLLNIPRFDLPPIANILLPEKDNRAQRISWSQNVYDGWMQGYRQANAEMVQRIRRLGQDYIGMIKYMQLYLDGKVVPAIFAKSTENVSGGDEHLIINDKTYQITQKGRFNLDSNHWKAIMMDSRGTLRFPIEGGQRYAD